MWESVGGARSAPRPRSSAQRRRGSIIVARARLQHRQMASKVVIPTDSAAADSLLASTELRVVNFCATWAEPCTVCNAAFAELANEHSSLTFIQLDADAFPDQCERFNLESVPAFLFLNGGKLIDSVMGADVQLVNKVSLARALRLDRGGRRAGGRPLDAPASKAAKSAPSLDDRLKALPTNRRACSS